MNEKSNKATPCRHRFAWRSGRTAELRHFSGAKPVMLVKK